MESSVEYLFAPDIRLADEAARRQGWRVHGRSGWIKPDGAFSYDSKAVLNGVNLVVPAGEMTVIFGPSGVGKTTLIDLITGLHRQQRGEVLVDGIPLDDIDLNQWRRLVGYVSQDTLLFNDTILNNVTLGDAAISAHRVRAALETAQASDFVRALPEGPLTFVGEGGSALSAGQRQRIALARALVVAPSLLILDEATAALDARTERAVMTALRSVPALTLLVVSHQPGLAAIADNVYDLANHATQQRGRENVVSLRRNNDLTVSSPA